MHIYEVIRRPVITEKSIIGVDTTNSYTFEVDMRANKLQIKEAVETRPGRWTTSQRSG